MMPLHRKMGLRQVCAPLQALAAQTQLLAPIALVALSDHPKALPLGSPAQGKSHVGLISRLGC